MKNQINQASNHFYIFFSLSLQEKTNFIENVRILSSSGLLAVYYTDVTNLYS